MNSESRQRLPLIKGYSASRPLLWRGGHGITQARLLGSAASLAERLPEARYLINLCDSRHAFFIGFVAGLLSGRTSLLPGNRLTATVDDLRQRYPDSLLLTDGNPSAGQGICVDASAGSQDWTDECPWIDADHEAAIVFTSGSTGSPQPYIKTWRNLVMTAGYAAERLQTASCSIVGTVPAQHMYGLETTVMPALAGDAIVACERPLFPEDLRETLDSIPAPRLLVTTPVHLQTFVQSGLDYPAVERIVTATAPLSKTLCLAAESHLGGCIEEIYGCTEAGSIATRRTRTSELWTPYREARVRDSDDGALVEGPHLPAAVRLSDIVQIDDDGRFRLIGRSSDMVKVAGKRASLIDLTQKLLALPGVEDGVIFIPHPDAPVARPAALVIAPTRTETELLEELSRLIDAVFLPRPLRKVERLPRNDVGKLPRAALLALLGS